MFNLYQEQLEMDTEIFRLWYSKKTLIVVVCKVHAVQ
jgi:hypothetical protein